MFSLAQKADFRAAEKFSSSNLSPKVGDMSVNAQWIEDKDIFWYSFKTPQGRNFYYVDAATRTKRLMFDRRYMAAQLHLLSHKVVNELDLNLRNLEFEKKSITQFTFQVDSVKYLYDMTTMKLTMKDTVKREAPRRRGSWASYSPDSTWITFGRKHNLYLMKAKDKDSVEYQLTTDGVENYSWASGSGSDTSNRRVPARVSWFKKSDKFYFVRRDSRKVKDLWVINVLSNPRPTLETYKYDMPGDEFISQSELHIFDPATKKKIQVNIAKWEDQSFSVEWTSTKTSDKLIFTRMNRTQKNMDVCAVNANTGDVKVLFSENIEPYISGNRLAVLNDGKDLIFGSERTGWQQLYLYDGDGNFKNQITDDYFVTGGIQRIDTAGRIIYFTGYGREEGVHPYYSMIYKASLDRKGVTLLTKEPANHSSTLSKSNRYFVDTYSTVDKAPKAVLRDNLGNTILDLEKVDLTELYKTGWKEATPIVVKARDGITNLYGVMYKPFDFDSTRKYPVISYVYPGPQTESVPYPFTVGGSQVSLAQVGFIVVNFGHRGGSPQRNQFYHSYGYSNLRDYALADDKYGIEQLADKYKFIDISKVGIYGHSGGGFMSTAAILGLPDFYKVAVSSSGNHDNNIYNRNWGEDNNGVTFTVKKTKVKENGVEVEKIDTIFKATVPANQDLAKNLKGYLLLVHGDIDNNVHPGNTIRVVDALIKANKRFDMLIMPGQRHGYGSAQNYFQWRMYYYFAEHLLGDYRTNVELMDIYDK
jgi:dipeptidyl-peptidase 4